jgi:hypothetical protein
MGSAHHDRGRLPVPRGEADETMPAITLDKALLRRSVDEHESQRHRCVHCHRTPLTGEVVHIYPAGDDERLVCELCRPLRRQEPARSELMHAPEHERSVRLKHRAA